MSCAAGLLNKIEVSEFTTINAQQYVDHAHKLRGEAMSQHFGIIKNVFKK